MKYCPNCGKEINETFNVCPFCGTNIKNSNQTQNTTIKTQNVSVQANNVNTNNKRKTNGCLISIITILLILGMVGYFADKYDVTTESEETKYNTSKVYSVGELLSCPDFDITVDNVQIKKKGASIDSYYVISDPEWIGVTLTVKNKSNYKETFYSSKVKLTNSNGEVLEHAVITYNVWGVPLLNSPTLEPGGIKTGYIDFVNNNDDNSNLVLNIDCRNGLLSEDVQYKVNISQ